jgi:hypothetical protein
MDSLANERVGFAFGHRGDWHRAETWFFERAIHVCTLMTTVQETKQTGHGKRVIKFLEG